MSIEILKKILIPTNEKYYNKNDWDKIQEKWEIKFPDDYKEIISLYGTGAINDFLWIFSPFSENKYLNLTNQYTEIKDSYEVMINGFPEKNWLNFYNGETGIFPWGSTDNGDELFWNYKRDNISIVVYESRYIKMNEYNIGMSEFLVKLLNKELYCDIFPDDFILDKNFYNRID